MTHRLERHRAALVVVDVQERLCAAMDEEALDAMLRRTEAAIRGAQALGLPTLVTEQYPKGLGATLPALRELFAPEAVVEKTCFSAVTEGRLLRAPGGGRRQWIVCGTEAHVCVQQTVLDLLAAGREVFVVDEAVGSRRPRDKALALERMRRHGADIVSREMVAFEWMERACTDSFRTVLKEFIR